MSIPRFTNGCHVRVLDLGKSGHVRIPVYIRDKTGIVIQYCGRYLNPEQLSKGITSGPSIDLYRVEFDMTSVWPKSEFPPGDTLVIEIYDHWLAPALSNT